MIEKLRRAALDLWKDVADEIAARHEGPMSSFEEWIQLKDVHLKLLLRIQQMISGNENSPHPRTTHDGLLRQLMKLYVPKE